MPWLYLWAGSQCMEALRLEAMARVLAGDIGGTKSSLFLGETPAHIRSAGGDRPLLAEQNSLNPLQVKCLYTEQFPSADFPDLTPIVQQFLRNADMALGTSELPSAACFAIAGPVLGHSATLTNLPWPQLTVQRLQAELAIAPVHLINDFLAIGHGVLDLKPSDLCLLQSGESNREISPGTSPIVVLGAGTGLGEAFLIPQGDRHQVFATEGGHGDFAPRSALEFELLEYLKGQYHIDRVSIERVVSGQGIVAIYQFLRDRGGQESPHLSALVRAWENSASTAQEKLESPAAAIAQAALTQSDTLAQQTLEIFVQAYGAEAGNLALKFLPYGGCYIAGGIAAKILPLMQSGQFMHAFLHKGRMRSLLERIPVYVVLNPQVGLLGAARYGAQLTLN